MAEYLRLSRQKQSGNRRKSYNNLDIDTNTQAIKDINLDSQSDIYIKNNKLPSANELLEFEYALPGSSEKILDIIKKNNEFNNKLKFLNKVSSLIFRVSLLFLAFFVYLTNLHFANKLLNDDKPINAIILVILITFIYAFIYLKIKTKNKARNKNYKKFNNKKNNFTKSNANKVLSENRNTNNNRNTNSSSNNRRYNKKRNYRKKR